MYHKKRHIHFVGIGGIGMSGLAEVLLNLGHAVSGSDLRDGDLVNRLSGMGADIRIGHSASNVPGADVVVVSSAVSESNPEVVAARRAKIPVIPRAEMLAELMRLKSSVAVAGSHGKSTTSSLLGMLLTHGGLDPTLVIGGKLNNLGVNARLGQGDFLVAEADESDGSFLLLNPTIAVVTNIDLEHMNFYRDMEHLKETFLTFINKVPFYGVAVLCLDDANVQSLIPKVRKRYITYGLSAQAEVTATNIERESWGYSFELVAKKTHLGRVTVNLPGSHNVLNALAAAAVGLDMGLDPKDIREGIAGMLGVARRFEKKGEKDGITVLDDYGHHPTEIRATLSALSECYPNRRLMVVFQPHRFSRTQSLFNEFVCSFNQVDKVYLADIYSAGEESVEGLNASILAEAMRNHGHRGVEYLGDVQQMAEKICPQLKDGDVVITLGAGNVWQVGEDILGSLGKCSDS